jgi:hypothetical protein
MPEPKFEDSQIDVVPIELRRDAVRFYISSLQRENLTLRQIITDMGKPLTPKGIGHAAKKGRL